MFTPVINYQENVADHAFWQTEMLLALHSFSRLLLNAACFSIEVNGLKAV